MTNEQQQLEKTLEIQEEEQVNNAASTAEMEENLQNQIETGESSSDTTSEPQETELTPEQIITVLTEEIVSLKQKLEEQNQQFEQLKSSHIRLTAEFDNFRKRTAREKSELETQIKGRTINELLSVVDNFERARGQIKPSNDGEMEIHKSYQSVYKNLVDSLKRLGVSPMRPEGEIFDPLYHEAMLREYTDEYPEGTIIEQLVRGYFIGDQVLRHAMVKVAAPKTPETIEAAEVQNTEEENASPS
ncbi:nucleotide exchange factor GrpE [Aphanothece sacrum]|uniref:Protein GrpE n=1 Tax=Aphanothece sacrum FPU1 TaxID=1920663 RepID=A0A401IEX8_APHSA|nr:nucleotide exchange factor GrpE [Aphanothece sacrum]GBF79776.1 GrpE protein [Aphanothece sacrum FPU1]GBF84788.1 molecular chaperone GrpE protein [Aphanothece sacrum FPU3]